MQPHAVRSPTRSHAPCQPAHADPPMQPNPMQHPMHLQHDALARRELLDVLQQEHVGALVEDLEHAVALLLEREAALLALCM